jgi:uncharacterized protein (TIGR02186 family)
MKHLISLISGAILVAGTSLLPAHAESLQMGVSVDQVPVSSSFDGAEIVIFGSIETNEQADLYRGEYDVVIRVEGAPEDVVIRKKERIGGIWINNQSQKYEAVPSFYSILSARPLDEIAKSDALEPVSLGIQNLGKAEPDIDQKTLVLKPGQFSDALRRLRVEQELFAETPGTLTQLSPSLFRARLSLPANVPIGEHKVTAYLFKDGQILNTNESSFKIEKIGFERWIYNLAHDQGLLHGIMAVLVAIFTGWAANAIFRKN